ncbi:hypothetical protein JR338_00145 [Chloroflexota bacterium]|nr:hypothetical protein JR338_00145 [Chloroflexota bacterium]
MTKRGLTIVVAVVLLAFAWVGVVYAQDDTGYPVDETETAVPTETETPEPTEVPTEESTQDPTQEPTEDPTTEPTEEPTPAPTEDPTEEPPVDPTETDVPVDTPVEDNPVCTGEREHPVLAGLAARYEVSYEELVGYYCVNDMGIGEIALALATIQQTDGAVDLPTLLSQRTDGDLGWGEIWQELGLTGQDHGGLALGHLKKEKERNQVQDQITNEGEDDSIQNEEKLKKDKEDKPVNSPPGQEKKNKDGGEFMPPGQEDKMDDGKRGNGHH